jgi:hypothetical protein
LNPKTVPAVLSAKRTISVDIQQIDGNHLPRHSGIYHIQQIQPYPAAYDADEYDEGSYHEEAATKVFLRCEV